MGAANRVHAVAIAAQDGAIRIFRGPIRQQLNLRDVMEEPTAGSATEAETDDRIRERAYELWLAEGTPEGRDSQHWEQAKE